jgi:hypothetical protein
MKTHLSVIAALAAVVSTPAPAQWLKYKTPGIPRTADGKPDLTAPAPKSPDGKPDLSGLWRSSFGGYLLNLASDLKPGDVEPWAEALYKQRLEEFGKDHPLYRCMPAPGPLFSQGLYRVIQTPSLVAMLVESGGGYRQIFTDGRGLPENPNPTWQGYSVGHWEGDTLVVESAGFNDQTWLDLGHPHTEALRVTERFRRKDFGHMQVQLTFDDPKTFKKPLAITVNADLAPDTEMLEEVCNENEKDVKHFVVTEEDRRKSRTVVKLSPEALAKFAGTYESELPGPGGQKAKFNVTLEGDQLVLQVPRAGKFPLPATEKENFFSFAGGTLEFGKNDQGAVTQLTLHIVEGDFKSNRIP